MAAGKIFHAGGKGEFQNYAGNFGGFGPRPKAPINDGQTHPLWDWGAFPERDDQMPDSRIADWTVKQLSQDHDRPFFLACGFYRPHVPMFAPQKWFDQYPLSKIQLPKHRADDFDDIPQYGRDLSWSAVAPRHSWIVKNDQWRKAVQSYLACVSFVDDQVGKVLDALDKSKYKDNTIIVLWSDHGFHLGTKQCWGKRSLWEDSTRVVLMIAGAGLNQRQVCHRPVGLIDVYPTLIDLAQLTGRTGLEGHSLKPLLDNPRAERAWPAITTFGQGNHSIRSQDYRYTVYADGTEELYDLNKDPDEFKNLASIAVHRKIIRRHRRFLPQINHRMAAGSHNADARPGSAAEIPADRERRSKKK